MSNSFFGVNIAKLIADGVAAAGGVDDITLRKVTAGTRTPGNLYLQTTSFAPRTSNASNLQATVSTMKGHLLCIDNTCFSEAGSGGLFQLLFPGYFR